MNAELAAGIPLAVAVHEAGHFSMARALGYRPRLVLHRLGVGTAWGDESVSPLPRVLVTAAGPLASLLFAGACLVAGFTALGLASLELGLLNLVPFPSSDGRRIWSVLRG